MTKCSACPKHPNRLKRGLCNTCYEHARRNGILNTVADAPIPNGAWLKGRGHRAAVLGTTPAHPVTRKPSRAQFVPKIREEHPIGTRTLWSNGYVGIKTANGTRPEHRVVMEALLGRPLLNRESVHHKNGDRADNGPGNLELWYRAQPAGQRVSDLIAYVVNHHRDAVYAELARPELLRTIPTKWPE